MTVGYRLKRLVAGEWVNYGSPQAALRDANPRGSGGETGVQNA